MTETQTFACNNNWLDTSGGSIQQALTVTGVGYQYGSNCLQTSYCPYWYYPVVPSPARPIKLKLSEIERLRKAAKGDKALKEILSKFTDQIEIEVDFE